MLIELFILAFQGQSQLSGHEVTDLAQINQYRHYADPLLVCISLAYCEIYMALAMLVMRVYPCMQLCQTIADDVKLHRDLFVQSSKTAARVFESSSRISHCKLWATQ